jgi:uncharacterized protein with GYD domain
MPTYIILANFTDQGIRNVKQTSKRADAFKKEAEKRGVTAKDFYWTMGQYDIVVTVEAPNDETVTELLFSLCSLGNVRTQTLRAFSQQEVTQITKKLR